MIKTNNPNTSIYGFHVRISGGSLILQQADVDPILSAPISCLCFKSLYDLYLICVQDLCHFVFLRVYLWELS